MNALCILVCMTVLGSIGWWLGCYMGLMAGFLLSSLGSLAGVYDVCPGVTVRIRS